MISERSAVTAVLAAEALAHGDMGIAYAALAPGAVASAIGLWGDAEQQATYLPAFVGDDVPAAALALLEPRPLFDPLRARRRRPRATAATRCSTEPSRSCRAPPRRAVRGRRARSPGVGPALFLVEAATSGLLGASRAGDGAARRGDRRAAARGRARPGTARCSATATREVYAECVHRARLAWCALALGTAQAVLDYVIPYVNERVGVRRADRQPPGGRLRRRRHRDRARRHAPG